MKIEGRCIDIRDLSVFYGNTKALTDISISLPEAKIIGIMGPNGSGKTTLLKCMTGLLAPDRGEVLLDGVPVGQQRFRLSYIPQKENIDWDFPLSVRDLVEMAMYTKRRWYQKLSAEQMQRVSSALLAMEPEGLQDRQIGELSGGQQQRAFMARALASDADVLVLDEPFTGIDAKATDGLIQIFQSLRDAGKTVILVHHDLANAGSFLDHVVLLKGSLLAQGPPEEVLTSEFLVQAYGVSFHMPFGADSHSRGGSSSSS